MTTRLLPLFLTIFTLTGCDFGRGTASSDNVDFTTEINYPNGRPEIVFKQLTDTVINGLTFSHKLKRQLDTLGQITREGFYIDDQAFGLHRFYQDNKVVAVREYLLFSPAQIKLLKDIDSLVSSDLSDKTTYLNSAYFLDNSDTIEDKSSFYKISLQTPIITKDSLRVHIEFHEPKIDIKSIDLYMDVPTDTSTIRIITAPGKNVDFRQLVNPKGSQTISGFAFLDGKTLNVQTGDTSGATRLMYFQKDFEVK